VLSALGLAIAPNRRSAAASVMRQVLELGGADVSALATRLATQATGSSPDGAILTWVMRARYVGQGHELDVPFAPDTLPVSMNDAFAARHQERYGFTLDRPVEIVSARCVASTGRHDVRLARRGVCDWGPGRRDNGGALDAVVRGRSTIVLPDATLLVADGWQAQSLPMGGWALERAP